MVKATLTLQDGGAGYLIGLTEENIKKLKLGLPAKIDLSELGGKGVVIVVYGEKEQDIIDQLAPLRENKDAAR